MTSVLNLAVQGGWIGTYTGKQVNILPELFDPDQVCFEDIAQGLPHINRYVGQTRYAYSVAQHCINLAMSYRREWREIEHAIVGKVSLTEHVEIQRLQQLEKYAFIHDWWEYATGDLAAPFKHQMPLIKQLEGAVTSVLAQRYGLPAEEPLELRVRDRRICRNEMDVLAREQGDEKWWKNLEPVPFLEPEDFARCEPELIRDAFVGYAKYLGLTP